MRITLPRMSRVRASTSTMLTHHQPAALPAPKPLKHYQALTTIVNQLTIRLTHRSSMYSPSTINEPKVHHELKILTITISVINHSYHSLTLRITISTMSQHHYEPARLAQALFWGWKTFLKRREDCMVGGWWSIDDLWWLMLAYNHGNWFMNLGKMN